MGDVKLALVIGLLLGWFGLSAWLAGLLAAFGVGGLIAPIALAMGTRDPSRVDSVRAFHARRRTHRGAARWRLIPFGVHGYPHSGLHGPEYC
jgi:hypothetical protein